MSDRSALAGLLATLPELTAVVHAAGVSQRDVPLADLTVAEYAETGRAKIGGAMLLDELLGDRPLAAFVLFSSGAAVWGSAGQAAYGGANAFLDGLAHRRRARGLTATSIAWGPLAAGMVDAELDTFLRRIGAPAMDPAVALEALACAFDRRESHLVVAAFDWAKFVPTYTLTRPRPLLDALPDVQALGEAEAAPVGGGETALVARLATLPDGERERLLLELVRTEVAVQLGHDGAEAVEPRRRFTDLGFDSVDAVELRGRLTVATGRKLPSTMVFDHATPAALAAYLRGELCADAGEPGAAELDRLERLAADLGPAEAAAAGLTARLRTLLVRLTEEADAGVGDRLQEASADDVFAFIDHELGLT